MDCTSSRCPQSKDCFGFRRFCDVYYYVLSLRQFSRSLCTSAHWLRMQVLRPPFDCSGFRALQFPDAFTWVKSVGPCLDEAFSEDWSCGAACHHRFERALSELGLLVSVFADALAFVFTCSLGFFDSTAGQYVEPSPSGLGMKLSLRSEVTASSSWVLRLSCH